MSRHPALAAGRILLLIALGLALLTGGEVRAADRVLTLGILSYRPSDQAVSRWQPLADYLSTAVPGYRVQLRALNLAEMDEALARQQLDLLLASPGYYIAIRRLNPQSSVIATLMEVEEGQPLPCFGGVIFTRSDRQDITNLVDLKGRTIAVADTSSLGGYQAPARELLAAGLEIDRQCRLLTTGMPQDQVVTAVLAGKADAGFVRTGLLEAMTEEGVVGIGQLKVVHHQQVTDFPLLLSTRLYPERPFIVLGHVPAEASRHLAAALLSLDPDNTVAQQARIYGFAVPANYSAVEDLLRDLRLPPFDLSPEITLADIWSRYRWFLLGLGLAGMVIVVLVLQLQRTNRRLRRVYRTADEDRERLRRISDNLLDSIVFQYSKDEAAKFTYVSSSIEHILGIPAARIQEDASLLFARVPPEMAPGLLKAARASLQAMLPLIVDLPLRTTAGDERWAHLCASPRQLSHGRILWDGVLTDITERKQMETALRDSQARLAQAQALAHVGSWQWDMATDLLTWSDETFRIFGYQPQEVVPDLNLFLATLHPDSRQAVRRAIEAALTDQRPYDINFPFRRHNGTLAYAHVRGEVSRDQDGQAIGMRGAIQDVTEQELSEQTIRASEARFRGIFDNASDGILIAHFETRHVTAANPAIRRMLGYSEDELLGMRLDDIHPADISPTIDEILKRQLQGEHVQIEAIPTRRKDGSLIYTDICASLLGDPAGAHTIAIFRDVTERKRHDDALRAALLEKEILVKEVHHRVKNNLQVITSMLNLQARRRADPALAAALLELGSRVRSMALIHEKLYRATDLAHIEFTAYMQELAASIVTSCALEGGPSLQLAPAAGPPVWLSLDAAIPCGLIVNELVTNSVKHAFSGRDQGQIRLLIREDEAGQVELTVSDNGIGMPRDVDPEKNGSLGLKLVFMLVRQLHGALSLDSADGTTTIVRFSKK